jgi:ACT domain-containing protein
MANEELIYRITRAVYARLGENASEQEVEALVMDVFRAVQPALAASASTAGASAFSSIPHKSDQDSAQRLIVSVFGVDHPGIVAGVAQALAETDCSIVDIDQTVVQGKFAMVIIADMSRAKESAAALKEQFREVGERLGVRIYAQREDLFNAMHRL